MKPMTGEGAGEACLLKSEVEKLPRSGNKSAASENVEIRHKELSDLLTKADWIKGISFFPKARAHLKAEGLENRVVTNA